jgi:hypothetical protein
MFTSASRRILFRRALNPRLNGGISEAKAARMARKSKIEANSASNSQIVTPFRVGTFGAFVLAGISIYDIQTNKDGILGKLYYGSLLEEYVVYLYNETYGRFREMLVPYEDKLLPTWPTDPVS